MKKTTNSLFFLIIGLALGWTIRPHLNGVSRTDDLARTNHKIVDTVDSCQASTTQLESVLNCKPFLPSPPTNTDQRLYRLINQQKVGQALAALNNVDLNRIENQSLLLALNNNLHYLAKQKNWPTLGRWVNDLLAEGYHHSLLHVMSAKIKESEGNTLAAINSLFLAKHYGITTEETTTVQKEIEKLVIATLAQYKNDASQITQQSVYDILHYVIEKQPDNPLFSIEMSHLQAASGDISSALDTLNLIPYSEQYQSNIVALKTQWLNQLNDDKRITTAIPLKRVNQHYVVTAVIDQAQTLDLLIDTGATTTALSKEAVDYLKSINHIHGKEGTVIINTANGTANVDYYRVNLFAIGNYIVEDFDLLEIELNELGEFDGLLGMNFLTLFEFELDQTNRQLFLTPK